MDGLIHVKQKGNKSIGFSADYVTLTFKHHTIDLDLGFSQIFKQPYLRNGRAN